MATRSATNAARDYFVPVAKRLAALAAEHGKGPNEREMVFTPDLAVADLVAVYAPQNVIWANHTLFAGALSLKEQQEMFFEYYYYSGNKVGTLEREVAANAFVSAALFGAERSVTGAQSQLTSVRFPPITIGERHQKEQEYDDYIATFNRERAKHPKLSYVVIITKASASYDLSNLDRWYQRDAGERIGPFTLYQVELR
jgi:hypothetical protein